MIFYFVDFFGFELMELQTVVIWEIFSSIGRACERT